MKKIIIAAVSFIMMFSTCDKMTTELEGKWQLKQIESEGSFTTVDTVWYNFQTSLFMYQIYDASKGTYPNMYGFNYFEKEGEVRLELSYNEDFLKRTDWTSNIRTFKIEKVSGKELILSSDGKKYYFDKF